MDADNSIGIDNILAEAYAQTRSMILFDYGLGSDDDPLQLLILLVHEVAHTLQYQMDADREVFETPLLQDNRWITPNFSAYLKSRDWSFKDNTTKTMASHVGNYVSLVGYDKPITSTSEESLIYKGVTLAQLQAEANSLEMLGYPNKDDPNSAEIAERQRQLGIVSDYSLDSPWEWHSEQITAWMLRRMEQHITNQDPSKLGHLLADRLAYFIFRGSDYAFNHRLMLDEDIRYYDETMRLTESSLNHLVCRYVIDNDKIFAFDETAKPLDHFSCPLSEAGLARFQLAVRENWKNICSKY